MKVIVFSLLLVGAFSAFRVKKVSPTEVRVKEGHPFKVICTTDNWYEVRRTDILSLLLKGLVIITACPTIEPNNDLFLWKQKAVVSSSIYLISTSQAKSHQTGNVSLSQLQSDITKISQTSSAKKLWAFANIKCQFLCPDVWGQAEYFQQHLAWHQLNCAEILQISRLCLGYYGWLNAGNNVNINHSILYNLTLLSAKI